MSRRGHVPRSLPERRGPFDDLLSSTARAKQVMMNAVNDRDSPVFAL